LVRIGVGKRDNAIIITIAPRRRDCVSSCTIEYLHPRAFIQSDIFNHEIATGIGHAVRFAQKPGQIGRFFSSPIEYYRPDRDAAWSLRMTSPAKTLIPVTALALVAQLTVAFADGVPHYNLEPLCRGIAQQGGMSLLPNQSAPKDYKSCIRSEMVVRRQLVKLWPTFKTSNKANCFGENSAGGLPSYTGLLSCLQMAQDASKMFGK
jgi:hypothetical protein